MTTANTILIIGGGHMGSALAKGIGGNHVTLLEPSEDRRNQLIADGFTAASAFDALPTDYAPSAIVLAIKPQNFADAAPDLRNAIMRFNAVSGKLPLLISILAGTSLMQLQSALMEHMPIVRAMPNTPALIKRGISACVASESASEVDKALAASILSAVGDVVWLESESHINAATALSGSGPAYVFYFLESLIEAGVAQGLPYETAHQLALATVSGSATLAEHMSNDGQIPLSQLRQNVTSPKGTTEAALVVLMDEKTGLMPLMTRTIARAYGRAEALAEESSSSTKS